MLNQICAFFVNYSIFGAVVVVVVVVVVAFGEISLTVFMKMLQSTRAKRYAKETVGNEGLAEFHFLGGGQCAMCANMSSTFHNQASSKYKSESLKICAFDCTQTNWMKSFFSHG